MMTAKDNDAQLKQRSRYDLAVELGSTLSAEHAKRLHDELKRRNEERRKALDAMVRAAKVLDRDNT